MKKSIVILFALSALLLLSACGVNTPMPTYNPNVTEEPTAAPSLDPSESIEPTETPAIEITPNVVETPTPEIVETQAPASTHVWVKGNNVNMRSAASTSGDKVAQYNNGKQLDLLEKGAEWSKVTDGTKTGYIINTYLSDTEIQP